MLEEWRSGDGIEVLDGWTFQFSSESHVYFKNEKMHGKFTNESDVLDIMFDIATKIWTSTWEISIP